MGYIIFWVGAFADFYTTRIGLAAGFREGNPLVRYVLDKLPFDSEIELAGIKLVVFIMLVLLGIPEIGFYIFGAAQFLAAANNFRLLRKAGVM